MDKLQCKYCNFIVLNSYYFCPNCGKKLHEPPLSTTIGKQIGLYALSFFIPPFGIIPAFKYLRQSDQQSKIIGIIAIALTFISIIIAIQILQVFLSNPLGLNSSSNLQDLQNLGY